MIRDSVVCLVEILIGDQMQIPNRGLIHPIRKASTDPANTGRLTQLDYANKMRTHSQLVNHPDVSEGSPTTQTLTA